MTCSLLLAPAQIQIEWHCRLLSICTLPQEFSPLESKRLVVRQVPELRS